MKLQNQARRLAALLLTLSMLLSLVSCGNEAKATTMHLKRAEGTVAVSDGAGEDVPLLEDLGLYSGYGVNTRLSSFAWINLDDVKLTKMDEDSEIAIQKEGKLLEIEVKSGSLFFNVTEPLAEDETMNIRTSTMMVGIRGTCGWVALSEDGNTLTVCLLEGRVECSNGGSTATVSAGEKGTIPASGEITVEKFSLSEVPAYVMDEVEGEDELLSDLPEDGGPSDSAPPTGTAAPPSFSTWAEAGLTDHVMDWQGPALAAAMAEITGISGDIMLSDVWELTSLDLSERGIQNVSALGELTNLTFLHLGKNQISDITPLSGMTNLSKLDLSDNQISDIGPLSGLANLTLLVLGGNQISDIAPLSGLTKLTTLHLENNNIGDISLLSGLTNLTMLHLFNTNISDVTPLSGLTNLTTLHLGGNQISDVTPLSSLTNLTFLYLGGNQISDVSPLSTLTNLTELNLIQNLITDYSPVEFVPTLRK